MYQIVYYSLLLLIAVASADQDICKEVHRLTSLTGAQAIRVLSYCVPKFVTEEVNAMDHVPEALVPKFYGLHCNYETLTSLPPANKRGADRMQFMLYCLHRAAAKPGEELPLSEDIIRQRIISQASDFVEDFPEEDVCRIQVLDEISFKELMDNFTEHVDCVIQRMLINIANLDNIGDFDFLPDYDEEENESESNK